MDGIGAGMENGFFIGHGLGNDYIVMDPKDLTFELTPERRIQGGDHISPRHL